MPEEKYKIALFLIIRNSQVLPVGKKLGKTEKEINQMAYDTMQEVLEMINYEAAEKLYEEGKDAR